MISQKCHFLREETSCFGYQCRVLKYTFWWKMVCLPNKFRFTGDRFWNINID